MTHDPNGPAAVQRTQQLRTARWCRYPGSDDEAVDRLNEEHDRLHVALCGLLERPSKTLVWVASGYRTPVHPTRHHDAVGWEEDLAIQAARWLNTGEYGGALRVLWWWGHDPEAVRAYLLQAVGRSPDEAPA